MLHLLIGPDRIALSDKLMEQLCKQAAMGVDGQILLVPEQFSHEMERRLCLQGRDTISRYAEVLSFSRLADRVAEVHGGTAGSYLDRGGRVLGMALAAEQVSSRMKLYGSLLRRPEFLVDMLTVVDEFQSYCLQPETLRQAAAMEEGQFAQKLEELSLLYEAYLAVCAGGQADPAGKLSRLRDSLIEEDWASKRRFYVDGFSDFTGAEEAVLEALLQQSEDIWITIVMDDRKLPVFKPARQTLEELRHLAEKWDIPTEIVRVKPNADPDSGVAKLLSVLFLGKEGHETSNIQLLHAESVEQECRSAVLHAKKLLQEGARCRDIAIACTDPGLYEAPLRATFWSVQLPYYFAGSDDLLAKPIVAAVLDALRAAAGSMEYEDVALYLKSGLPLLDRDRCDRLDCYAYLWNIRHNLWEKSWEFHPKGFGADWSPEDEKLLARLNEDRAIAMEPLLRLRRGLQKAANTGEMIQSLYGFLEAVQFRQRLEEQALESGGQLGQELSQLYEILCTSLEQTWLILGQTQRSAEDFEKLYRTVISQYQVGTIPAGLDQIYVGPLLQMRQKQVPHLLVLGCCDGAFPSYLTGEGLLTEDERLRLMNRGVSLAPLRADQMDREMSRIYTALSASTETVWLSYAADQPAWLYSRAENAFPKSVLTVQQEQFLDIPSFAAWRLRHDDQTPISLKQLDAWEKKLRALRDYRFTDLTDQTVQGLYGRQINLSASRIDKYAACRFAFFLAYGLKAQPRKQAKLDPSAFGTFVHEVLEHTVVRIVAEGGFRQVSEDRLLAVAMEEIEQYASAHFPKQSERSAYLFNRSKQEILDIVRDLGQELRVSGFQPVSCELDFQQNGSLPPVYIEGEKCRGKISGFVDRVDLYEENGQTYVRVVDYKTGYKDFDYTDILNGIGLQMLIYLFALKQYGGSFYGVEKLEPAGVLYLPARNEYTLVDHAVSDEDSMAYHREERRRRGVIRSDEHLLSAMEEDAGKPAYMPYKIGKNGPSGNLATASQMELLERHVFRALSCMTDSISTGKVGPNPIVRGQDSSCRFCDFQSVCHKDLGWQEVRSMAATSADKFWEKLQQEEEHNG